MPRAPFAQQRAQPWLSSGPELPFFPGQFRPNGPTGDLHSRGYFHRCRRSFNRGTLGPLGRTEKTRQKNVAYGRCSRAAPFAGRVAGPSAQKLPCSARNMTCIQTFCTKPPNLSILRRPRSVCRPPRLSFKPKAPGGRHTDHVYMVPGACYFVRREALRSRRRRGASALELSIVLMLFLTVTVGMLDLGREVFLYHVLNNAARQGARRAIVHGQLATVEGVWGPTKIGPVLASTSGSYGIIDGHGDFYNDGIANMLVGCNLSQTYITVNWNHSTALASTDASSNATWVERAGDGVNAVHSDRVVGFLGNRRDAFGVIDYANRSLEEGHHVLRSARIMPLAVCRFSRERYLAPAGLDPAEQRIDYYWTALNRCSPFSPLFRPA